MPADRYVFLGFPPRKGGDRETWLERIRESSFTVVCFEAPTRTVELLSDLARVCGSERRAVVARELTKRFEEFREGPLAELVASLEQDPPRGEVTIVIAGARESPVSADGELARQLARALSKAEVEPTRAAKVIAEVAGLSRADSYRLTREER
jgi:16S rRNA (cytidine1402-2'-O)-methyltransferase